LHGFFVFSVNGLSYTWVNQAVADFPSRGDNLSRNSEMVDCSAALRPGGLFKKGDAVRCFILGKEEIPSQVSVSRLKIMGEIRMPARSHSLKKNCLRCPSNLKIETAGCTVFNRIQILIDGGLPALIHQRIQRSCVSFIVNDEQWIPFHKSRRGKDICPKPENTVVLF